MSLGPDENAKLLSVRQIGAIPGGDEGVFISHMWAFVS